MATNKKDLKSYVRYDGTGRVVAGSNILQRSKPKDGNWKQIGAYECCDPYCLPPVYGEDYIIYDAVEVEGGITFQIATNPYISGLVLEVCMVDCDSTPPDRILPLQIELIQGNEYNYFVPDAILDQSCALGFRRICTATKSGWALSGG